MDGCMEGVNEPKVEDQRQWRRTAMYGDGIGFEMDSMKINDRSGPSTGFRSGCDEGRTAFSELPLALAQFILVEYHMMIMPDVMFAC